MEYNLLLPFKHLLPSFHCPYDNLKHHMQSFLYQIYNWRAMDSERKKKEVSEENTKH